MRYCAVVEDSEGTRAGVESLRAMGWEKEPIPLSDGPEPVLALTRVLPDEHRALEELSSLSELREGILPSSSPYVRDAIEQLMNDRTLMLIGNDEASGEVVKLGQLTVPARGMLPDAVSGSGEAKPEPVDGTAQNGPLAGEKATSKASPGASGQGEADETPAPSPAAPATEVSQVFATGVSALEVPAELWTHVAADERAAIAAKALRDIYEVRSTYTDPVPWVLAPESRLLAEAQDQAGLAADILRAREGIADHQLRLAKARALAVEQQAALLHQQVKAAEKELGLVEKRVELAGQGVAVAQELVNQMKRWLELADWGKWALTISLGLAVVGVGVLLYFLGEDKINGWEVALATFALALFVISPAVLLLRERPLKGLDQWMPGAKPEAPATEPKQDDKASKKASGKKATAESAEDG